MTLNAAQITRQLSSSATAAANLSASCQGILEAHLQTVSSPWFANLSSQLQQAQALAGEWRNRFAGELQTDVLTCVVHCGQGFGARRATITNLFNSTSGDFASVKAQLVAELTGLSSRYIGSIERAKVSASVTILGKLASALKVDPCLLIKR